MKKMFRNDYCELAHERILRALLNAKDEQNVGYGLDTHSENARRLIKENNLVINTKNRKK